MTLPRKHTRAGRATVTRLDAITQACRPMADYLFGEALGAPPSKDLLRSAKDALLPLRGHPGGIGRAVIVLLEGGESPTDYDDAVSVLLRAARGRKDGASGRSGEWDCGRESAPVISLLPRPSGVQLAFPGLDD